jgi:hypothetical protein
MQFKPGRGDWTRSRIRRNSGRRRAAGGGSMSRRARDIMQDDVHRDASAISGPDEPLDPPLCSPPSGFSPSILRTPLRPSAPGLCALGCARAGPSAYRSMPSLSCYRSAPRSRFVAFQSRFRRGPV